MTDWTKEDEPTPTGAITKTVRPAPDPLKSGVEALQAAADKAARRPEWEVEQVRRSLKPVLDEAAALMETYKELDSLYRQRLETIVWTARRRELRRYPQLDRVIVELDRSANDALQLLNSALRVLGGMPGTVQRMTPEDVATKRFLDRQREVACLRDGPARIRGIVAGCERLLSDVERITTTAKPARNLIEAVDPSKDTDNPKRRQERADSAYDPFPGTPEGIGNPQPFIL